MTTITVWSIVNLISTMCKCFKDIIFLQFKPIANQDTHCTHFLRKYSNLSEKQRLGFIRDARVRPPVRSRGLWGFSFFKVRASPSEPLGSFPMYLRVTQNYSRYQLVNRPTLTNNVDIQKVLWYQIPDVDGEHCVQVKSMNWANFEDYHHHFSED